MAGHIVKKRRNIEEGTTAKLTTSNLKTTVLSVQGKQDSILTLGQGLEWSGWYNK
jgi:hypothetical protein